MTRTKKHLFIEKSALAVATSDLPEGVIGRIEGIACVYDTPDAEGDIFAKGAFLRTNQEKVRAGKVKLFAALESSNHVYGIQNHVGIVRELYDDGLNLMMKADILDTEEGRKVYEYLKQLISAGGNTGLSVGVRAFKYGPQVIDGKKFNVFNEVSLMEITITTMPAYVGTAITSVKSDNVDSIVQAIVTIFGQLDTETQMMVLETLESMLPEEDTQEEVVTEESKKSVPWEDRLAVIRKLMQD